MSKPLKNMMTAQLADRLKGVETLGVINPRGIDAIKTNHFRRRLRTAGLRMTVVRNALARRAVGDGKLKGFDRLLDGPSALIYGGQAGASAIARLLLEEKKANDTLELRGIFFDGDVYAGDKGVETVSKLPTREEAISTLLALILSPARNLAGAIKGPGGKLGAILKTVEDKAKEKDGAAPAAA
ncbi:MAG TPA: 50S ribosomal protein L10 [Tepidisphaeraceae bacterium]|nr:50S ribosomal protein L10 [Tepidisphaeraceae bacterium]